MGVESNIFEGYFMTLHKMNRTSWIDLIHSYLMQSIRDHIKTPGSVSGCVIYLLYLFAKHNNIMRPDHTGLPRMVKWMIAKISTTIENDVGGAMNQMSRTLVTPYLDGEQKSILDW